MTCARVVFILLVWLNAFGMAGAKTLRADLNGDCRVDMADLIILLQEWMQEGDCEMSLGDELIVNGDFDTDTDWTKGERWSIDTEGGLALFNSPTFPFGSLLAPEVPVVLEAEKTYQVSVTLLIQAGSGQIELSTGPVITTSGSHTFTVTGIAGNFSIEGSNTASAFVTYIDNVSVREVLPDEGGGPVMQQLYEQYYER